MAGTDNLAPYLASMSVDPVASDTNETGYSVVVDTNGIVTVASCAAEDDAEGDPVVIQSSR